MKVEQKLPPLILVLVFSALMLITNTLFKAISFSYEYKLELLMLCLLSGLMLAFSGVVSFKKHKTTVNPMNTNNVNCLVTSGIYRFTRNPMYLGMLIGLIGLVIYLANPLNIVLLITFIWYMNEFQIKPEEKFLSKMFSTKYDNYKHRVNRWF